jgi:flagella basal body P-ring formation protein FlgA
MLPLLLCLFSFSFEIELRKNASVVGREITVADIAENCKSLPVEIQEIVVAKSAPAGFNLVLGTRQISSAISSSHKANAAVQFTGSEKVSVRTSARIIVSQQVADIARREIIESMPWEVDQVRIDIGKISDTMMVPEGEIKIEAELPLNCNYRNSQTVQIIVSQQGRVVRKFPATARIRIYEDVCVAKTRINRHEQFSLDKIRIERREITEITRSVFGVIDSLLGKTVDKTIIAGKVITDDFVKEPLLVRKGEMIRIVTSVNDAVVSVDGEALRDGVYGANVPVRNMLTGKRINAFVVGEAAVSLQKPNGGLL